MSTAERPTRKTVPPLVEGQRLDQPEFHRRYEAMPPGTRAELIDGVVFMPSPVGPEHGRAQVPALVWLSYYEENTPGVEVLDSRVFPGLWLDPEALLARATRRLRAVLDQALATPEHAALAAKLAAARARGPTTS